MAWAPATAWAGWCINKEAPMPNRFDSDTDRTPGGMAGRSANSSLERSGAMGLPMGRDQS